MNKLSIFRSICTLKTTVVSLGISVTVSLGIYSVLSFLSCYFLTNPAGYPIRYPASILLGWVCFIVFCALMYLYVKLRRKALSVKGVVMDVIFALILIVPFIFAFGSIDSILADMVHSFC